MSILQKKIRWRWLNTLSLIAILLMVYGVIHAYIKQLWGLLIIDLLLGLFNLIMLIIDLNKQARQ